MEKWTVVVRPYVGFVEVFFRVKQAPGSRLSFSEALRDLQRGGEAARALDSFLRNFKDYRTYFLELPWVSGETASSREFTLTLTDAPELRGTLPDPSSFATMLRAEVNSFRSLSGDALLVCPGPDRGAADCSSIGPFVRTATARLRQKLFAEWARVVLEECLPADPKKRFWMSTSGLAVPWLHLRIDTRPKYYKTKHYRE